MLDSIATFPYCRAWIHRNDHFLLFCFILGCCCFSVTVSDSLRPRELQHARLPCPSLSPRVCSNACPLSRWCYLTISFSASPFLLLPSLFPSIRVFSNRSVLCIRWPNCSSSWRCWSFRFSISPSGKYSGLISFRIDWFDLLTVQGALKNLLQHYRWKASILWCFSLRSAFSLLTAFLYCPTLTSVHDYWKNHSFDYMYFGRQVMCLLLNMLSRFVIAFVPRSKCLLVSWLQSLSAVILESKKIKSVTISTFSPSICHVVMGRDATFWVSYIIYNSADCLLCGLITRICLPMATGVFMVRM